MTAPCFYITKQVTKVRTHPCKRALSFWVLLILTFFSVLQASASDKRFNIPYRLLDQESGIRGKKVYDGLQDGKGYIWLATANGVVKYDGNNFLFLTKEKDGLRNNNVLQICEDAWGFIWMSYDAGGTYGQVDILEPRTLKVYRFQDIFKRIAPFDERDIFSLSVNSNKEIYIVCRTGYVYLYAPLKGFRQLNTHAFDTRIFDNFYAYRNYATNEGIWMQNRYFLSRSGKMMDAYPTDGYSYSFMHYDNKASLYLLRSKAGIRDEVVSVSTDGVVTRSADSLAKYNPLLSGFKKRWLFSATSMDGNTVLIENSGKGLYLKKGDELITLFDSTECNSYGGISATSMFTDRTDKVWVCTNVGLFIFKVTQVPFKTYLTSTDKFFSVPIANYQTRGIYADTLGNVYVNSTTGTYHFNENAKPAIPHKISGEMFTNQMIERDGKLYFGYTHLYEYDMLSKKLSVILGSTYIKPIWTLRKRKFGWWIGNQHGLSIYHHDKWTNVYSWEDNSLNDVLVNQFFKDHDKQWWVVTSHGLYTMKNDSVVKDHYHSGAAAANFHLPYDNINHIHEDKDNVFWMATSGGGLVKWDKKHDYNQYTVADGLCSNNLYAILEDEKGYLWISSDNGLMQFDKKNSIAHVYTVDDGLKNNEFNRLSYFKRADGKMYFGSVDGIISFEPSQVAMPGAVQLPLQLISAYQYNNKTNRRYNRTGKILETGSITLNPDDNNLRLQLGVLDYEQKKHRFYYQLEPLHNNWVPVENSILQLTSLPVGDFTLRVRARDNNGQLLKDQITIQLTVIPPFYKSRNFLLLIVALSVLLVAISFLVFARIKKHRERMLLKLVDERTKALQASLATQEELVNEIHHRVKNNLQVISGLLELQSLKLQDEGAKEALRESQNRVVSIAMIHQQLYKHDGGEKVEFGDFIAELFAHVSALYEVSDKARLVLDLPRLFFYTDIAIPMGLVLNELITNSLKYAAPTVAQPVITITYKAHHGFFDIIYQDNGSVEGANAFQNVKGFGLNMVQKLVEQIGATLIRTYSNGTKYVITLGAHHNRQQHETK